VIQNEVAQTPNPGCLPPALPQSAKYSGHFPVLNLGLPSDLLRLLPGFFSFVFFVVGYDFDLHVKAIEPAASSMNDPSLWEPLHAEPDQTTADALELLRE
jgi:hypothetical protein